MQELRRLPSPHKRASPCTIGANSFFFSFLVALAGNVQFIFLFSFFCNFAVKSVQCVYILRENDILLPNVIIMEQINASILACL